MTLWCHLVAEPLPLLAAGLMGATRWLLPEESKLWFSRLPVCHQVAFCIGGACACFLAAVGPRTCRQAASVSADATRWLWMPLGSADQDLV